MKRNVILATLMLTTIFAPKASAIFGFGEDKKPDILHDKHVNTVEFWTTVQNLLVKNGYDTTSDFYKHAHSNLERAESRQAHHKEAHPQKHHKALTKEVRKNKESEAFKKGKKAGEDHERRLLKKKAKAQTNTPRKKKKVKKVVEQS